MLPPKIKIRIKENGIKHYTNLESAEKVYSNKYIGIFMKSPVFFFVNEPIALDVLCYNLRYLDTTSNNRLIDSKPTLSSISGKNRVIIIRNLSDSQLSALKYDFCNEAIVSPNRFVFLPENDIFIEDADFSNYPQSSKNCLFKLLKTLIFRKGQLDKL